MTHLYFAADVRELDVRSGFSTGIVLRPVRIRLTEPDDPRPEGPLFPKRGAALIIGADYHALTNKRLFTVDATGQEIPVPFTEEIKPIFGP